MGDAWDAIIVGGGHNGLVAAGYLAKAGCKVLVLERRPIVGGACVTEEVFPGVKFSRLAYSAGLLRPEIIRDLDLPRFGYEVHPFDPQFFLPFPNGKSILLWNDADQNRKELARFSRKDAESYPKYVAFWTEVTELIEALVLGPPPPLPDLLSLFQGPEAEELAKRILLSSAADLLDEFFESQEVKAMLVTGTTIGLPAGPRTPGTALMLGHMLLHEINGAKQTFGYAQGGMGGISQAIAKAAVHFGATIRTSAAVRRILTKDRQAIGVELEDGTRLMSRAVLANVDVKTTFEHLTDPDAVDPGFLANVRRIKASGVVTKVNCVLSELPDFISRPGKAVQPHHRGYIDVCPSVDYLERAWDDAKWGEPSREPFLDCVLHSVMDPSLAPAGKFTLSIYSQYSPYRLNRGQWDDRKEEVGDTILETLASVAPNLRHAVEQREVLSPLDMERTWGLPGGCIYQTDMTPDQLFSLRPLPGWSGYRTPVGNLYLCGSSAHPGGGVTGAPGRNAAIVLLEDRRRAVC
ncbi:MAG: NAD(P)/FAD-dependent oxidoreductase [Thermoplasmata archaeon]|nr:NAD(P)/FAD-dependent oxidoreductase [Thermoplasmata archaeon]